MKDLEKNTDRSPPQDLRERTRAFALRIIHMYAALPKAAVSQVIGHQALRAGTSVGAHYREATRGRSIAEFISKCEGGLMELEETGYWLELLIEGGILPAKRLTPLLREVNELTAIFVTCIKNAKRRKQDKS